MHVSFDIYSNIIRSIKVGDWNYSFKGLQYLDKDRDRVKTCTSSAPEKFKNECEFLVIQKTGNGYICWLSSKPGKDGHSFNEKRGYEGKPSWKELQKLMKEKHGVIIPEDRQIEILEDFVSRVNGNNIDLSKQFHRVNAVVGYGVKPRRSYPYTKTYLA